MRESYPFAEEMKEERRNDEKSRKIVSSLDPSSDVSDLAFNSTNQLITLSNLVTGEYVEVNQAFLDTLGYRKEEIIGKTSDDIQLYVDLVQSRKFIRLLARLMKVQD